MFDRLLVKCPNKNCNGEVEFQSKMGECNLCTYDVFDVPPEITMDVKDDIGYCPICENEVKLNVKYMIHIEPYIS